MIRSVIKVQNLALLLKKEDKILISQAIELLREEPPFEGAISLLAGYYNDTDNKPIRKSIEGFFNDLKDTSVITEVIAEIGKKYKDSTISMLVSSCWQSGLNYSEYSKEFAEVFMKGDYVTAIECLTVIGENIHDLSVERKNEIRKLIMNSNHTQTEEKKALVVELFSILER